MDIFSPTIIDNAIITGSNNASLLQVSSPSAASAFFISGSGNIGIGTTSPSVRLHLSQSSGIFQRVDINNANADGVNATQQYYTNTGATPDLFGATSFRLQGGTTDAFKQFQVYIANLTSPRFIINGSGNVGINTTSPNARLHISGANSDVLLIASSSAAPSALFVSGSGNVGIGTGTPTNTLQVVGGITATSITASIISASSGITGSLLGTSSWAQSASNAINAQTASFLPVGTYQITSSWAVSASNSINARTSSNIFPAITNNTSTYVLTATGNGTINGNSNLTFDGSDLTLGSSTGIVLPSNGYVKGPQSTILLGGNATYNVSIPNDFVTATASFGSPFSTRIQLLTNVESIPGGYDSGSIFFKTPSGSGMTYTNEGRLGIGISNPINTLEIQGNVSASSYTGSLFGTSSWAINALTASFINTSSTNAFVQNGNSFGTTALLGTNDNQNLQLETSGSVRMTISSSGNVGIGTTTPSTTLNVNGTTLLQGGQTTVRGSGATSATTALRIENSSAAARLTILDDGTSAFNTSHLYVSGSGLVGVGTALPTAKLHVSGASVDSLLQVGSPTNANILFVNGNGRVGINTTSSAGFLGGNISTFTIFQNSGSGDGLTPSTGLQIVNSGSSTSAQAQLSIVTVGDKFAAFNIGTSGSGTQNNYWHLSKRNAANGHALNLYNNNNGTFSGPLFSFVSAGTSTLGEYTQIQINDITGRVGLQTTPSDYIHLYSEPGTNYLRIDATSVQAPPVNAASAKNGYGIIENDYFLAEPDYWMEIKLDANVVLIPCYLPG